MGTSWQGNSRRPHYPPCWSHQGRRHAFTRRPSRSSASSANSNCSAAASASAVCLCNRKHFISRAAKRDPVVASYSGTTDAGLPALLPTHESLLPTYRKIAFDTSR